MPAGIRSSRNNGQEMASINRPSFIVSQKREAHNITKTSVGVSLSQERLCLTYHVIFVYLYIFRLPVCNQRGPVIGGHRGTETMLDQFIAAVL